MTDAAEARPDEDRNQDADEVAALQTAPGRDWTGALDEAARRLVATKGWKGPEDVVSSYGHLEKLIGQKGVIRPGDNAPPEAWDSYYRALGRPDRPGDYAFGSGGDDAATIAGPLADAFRDAAHGLGLSQAQAAGLYDWYTQAEAAAAQEMQGRDARAGAAMDQALREEWAGETERNIAIARRAARHFGDPETLDVLERHIGAAALVKMFYRIGNALSEDVLTADGGAAGFGHNPASARSEIARLNQDSRFQKSYFDKTHPDHGDAVSRMEALFRTAYPEAR